MNPKKTDADSVPKRLHFLKSLGFEPRTILDIGAHMGGWSRGIHSLWPRSRIFAVEANPDLEKEIRKLKWLKGYEISLLGEKQKKNVPYYACVGNYTTGNSIFREQTWYFGTCKTLDLPMTTLDVVVSKNKLLNIDFIKVDTQGSELAIMMGGKKTVAGAEFVLLEIQNLEFNLGAPRAPEVIDYMDKHGFYIFDIPEIHQLGTGEMAQFDILFARKDSKFIKKGVLS